MLFSFVVWMVFNCQAADLDKDLSAEMIASKMFYANNWDTSVAEIKMEIINKGISRFRTFVLVEKDRNNTDYWSMLKFSLPKDLKDLGLLTINLWKKETEQWVLKKGSNQPRQIIASEKQEQLIGSDLVYEDFRKRDIDLDVHLRLPDRKFHGVDCYAIRSSPKNPSSSFYQYREYCIHPQNFLPLEILYFIKDKSVKRMSALELKQVQFFLDFNGERN